MDRSSKISSKPGVGSGRGKNATQEHSPRLGLSRLSKASGLGWCRSLALASGSLTLNPRPTPCCPTNGKPSRPSPSTRCTSMGYLDNLRAMCEYATCACSATLHQEHTARGKSTVLAVNIVRTMTIVGRDRERVLCLYNVWAIMEGLSLKHWELAHRKRLDFQVRARSARARGGLVDGT